MCVCVNWMSLSSQLNAVWIGNIYQHRTAVHHARPTCQLQRIRLCTQHPTTTTGRAIAKSHFNHVLYRSDAKSVGDSRPCDDPRCQSVEKLAEMPSAIRTIIHSEKGARQCAQSTPRLHTVTELHDQKPCAVEASTIAQICVWFSSQRDGGCVWEAYGNGKWRCFIKVKLACTLDPTWLHLPWR